MSLRPWHSLFPTYSPNSGHYLRWRCPAVRKFQKIFSKKDLRPDCLNLTNRYSLFQLLYNFFDQLQNHILCPLNIVSYSPYIGVYVSHITFFRMPTRWCPANLTSYACKVFTGWACIGSNFDRYLEPNLQSGTTTRSTPVYPSQPRSNQGRGLYL